MITPDTARAMAERHAPPANARGYDCCGCTTGATVDAPDGLCADCKPRHADAGEHATACRCGECDWYGEVETRRMYRASHAELTSILARVGFGDDCDGAPW